MPSKNKSKKIVSIELCGEIEREYKGRLLGLINHSEFFRIMNSRRIQNKLFSNRSVPINEIAEYAELEGMRIVIAVKEINERHVNGKHLFITEPLSLVANVKNGDIGILSEKNEYLLVSEGY